MIWRVEVQDKDRIPDSAGRSIHSDIADLKIGTVEDVRVVLIKLAERTAFLKSTHVLLPEQRQALAGEMLDIYAPLANRLGIHPIKWQLEDEAFAILNAEIYQEISRALNSHRQQREGLVTEAIQLLTAKLEEIGTKGMKITGRAKHIYSIYRKMQRKNVGLDQIYDVLAIRILTTNIEDCYATLSAVHEMWDQIPQEFDDYIATPKSNGYQSIHTAVVGPGQKNLEVQIRSFDMHKDSELGVAAHWYYKQGGKKFGIDLSAF